MTAARVENASRIPARVQDVEAARARFGVDADRLVDFMSLGDPLADACVEAFSSMPPGVGSAMLDRALTHGVDMVPDAPPALRALFAEIDRVPEWVDWDALERGGELLLRAGPFGAQVLGFRSLVLAYASPAGNKPLVLSGRLTEQASRRLAETGRFVHLTAQPASLRRYGEGFRVTVRVRMMHAQVRRLVRRSGKWRAELWGDPVNQHDMVATILLFSVSLIDGLRTLGFAIDDGEASDCYALWRYSGFLLGVDRELLPETLAAGRRLGELIKALQGPPDDDGRALVAALFGPGLGDPKTRGEAAFLRAYRHFAWGLARILVGDELADRLDIPKNAGRHAAALVRPTLEALERVRVRSRLAHRALVAAGDARWKRVIDDGLAGEAAKFHMPSGLGGRLRGQSKGAGASSSP